MIKTYRNAAIDELMDELIKLREDLNELANNFNQTVYKLHTLGHVTLRELAHRHKKSPQSFDLQAFDEV